MKSKNSQKCYEDIVDAMAYTQKELWDTSETITSSADAIYKCTTADSRWLAENTSTPTVIEEINDNNKNKVFTIECPDLNARTQYMSTMDEILTVYVKLTAEYTHITFNICTHKTSDIENYPPDPLGINDPKYLFSETNKKRLATINLLEA